MSASVLASEGNIIAEPETLFVGPGGFEGCWVSFFAGPGFQGPSAYLAGRTYIESFGEYPIEVVEPELAPVGGQAFLGTARSVVVGPNARVVGYEEKLFRDRELELGPGTHVPDLRDIGFHQRVQSLKIFCVPR